MRIDKMREYPIGSISSGTMRPEDLIPTFCSELESLATGRRGILNRKQRAEHKKLVREIEAHIAGRNVELPKPPYERTARIVVSESVYYDSECASWDLESLSDALGEYAGPYFYFGAHPGDGADYGFWLNEDWQENFASVNAWSAGCEDDRGLAVKDLSEIPAQYRGEVAHVNDHGNVTLYVKTSRGLREVCGIV